MADFINRFISSCTTAFDKLITLDFGAGVFNRGVSSMDAGSKPTGKYSRRPLLEIPASKSELLTEPNPRTGETSYTLHQTINWLVILTYSFWLSACSFQSPPNSNHELQITTNSPVPTENTEFQNISSFDVYVDKQTIHTAFTSVDKDSKQTRIGYMSSTDSGLHWSKPVEISKTIHLPVESKAGNDIQIAAAGENLLITWQTTGEIPGMGPLVTVYSTDGGQTWQNGANPTGSDTDQSHADLLADPQGHFHLVWLDDRDENGYQGLRYAKSKDVGLHWESAQTLDDSTCSCCWNRLFLSADGKINVLYRDMEPRDMALMQTQDDGLSWQRLSTVGEFNWKFDGCPHNGGAIAETSTENLHSLVWTGAENRVGLYHMLSTDAGNSWSKPTAVSGATSAFHSDIAARDENILAAVWDAMGPEGSTVMLSYSADNGKNWSANRLISTPGVSASFPRIVATETGWLAMWTEQYSKTSKKWIIALIK